MDFLGIQKEEPESSNLKIQKNLKYGNLDL